MGKMSDLSITINGLRSAAGSLNEIADWLEERFSGDSVPESEPAPTLEDVRAVLAEASRNGHTAEIRALLEKYGAAKLSAIDPSHYAELLKDAEGFVHAG